MKDFVEIGPAPGDELCAQLGDEDYEMKSRQECRRFIDLIRKKLGPEPENAKLVVKSFSHDFGTYREVVCCFDDDCPKSMDYAFECESNAPMNWEE